MSQCARRERLFLACVAAVGKDPLEEGKHSTSPAQQMEAAVAILNVGRMNDGVEQQTQRIYQKVALATFDLLACIIAMRIDTRPPFSALLTL